MQVQTLMENVKEGRDEAVLGDDWSVEVESSRCVRERNMVNQIEIIECVQKMPGRLAI